MFLDFLVDRDLLFPDLPAYDIPTLLRAFARRIVAHGTLEDDDVLYRALMEREKLGSTGIGKGIAVPHCKIAGLDSLVLAVGHVEQAIDFNAVDGAPVRLFFVVVSPESQPAAHLRCLAAISKWIQESGDAERLLELDDPEQMYHALVGRASEPDSDSGPDPRSTGSGTPA